MAINRLPGDVLQIVFEDVFNDSPLDARTDRLVCRVWDAWLRPVVFRTLHVYFSRRRNVLNSAMFQCLRTKDTATSSLIRRVEIHEWHESGLCPVDETDLEQPVDWLHTGLLPSKTRKAEAIHLSNQPIIEGGALEQVRKFSELLEILSLHQFRWLARPRIPRFILLQLGKSNPNCELSIGLRVDRVIPEPSSYQITVPSVENLVSLEALRLTCCLRSLNVAVLTTALDLFSRLQNFVCSCPTLQELSVYAVSRPCSGLVKHKLITTWPWNNPNTEAFMDSLSLRKLSLENFCICHDPHTALWLMWADWQMLRSACFTCPSFVTLLGNRLADLRSLELLEIFPDYALAQCRGPSASLEVRNSLSNCTQLIHLNLRNCSTIVNDSLMQHVGAVLEKLCMHEDERRYHQKQRNGITELQIFAISKYCSKLSHLEIDIDYELGWPLHTFDLIASKLYFIQHIGLNFELGAMRMYARRDPRRQEKTAVVTEVTAKQIYCYIRRQRGSVCRVNSDKRSIQTMTVSRGSIGRPDIPLPPLQSLRTPNRMWYYAHSVSLHIKGNAQYDITQQLQMLSVTCPELERLEYVQKNLDYADIEVEYQISSMRRGIRDGPERKPDLVLQLPGFDHE